MALVRTDVVRAAIVLFLLVCASAGAATLPPESLAVSFYDAWARNDVRALRALWQKSSPDYPPFRRRVEPLLRVRCFTVLRLTASASANRIEAEAVLRKSSRTHPAGDSLEVHHAIFDVARTKDGWRITRWRLREEMAADDVAASPDAAVAPELISATLDRFLCARAVQVINQSDYGRAARVASLAKELAIQLGDTAGLALARGIDSILLRKNLDLDGSARAAEESIALAESAHDPDALARGYLRAARALKSSDAGDRRRRDLLERALALDDDVEEPSIVALAASQMAAFYDDQGNHLMARRYAEKTLKIAEASGDDIAVISAELNLGGNYMVQGDDALALPHFERVVSLSKRARYQMGVLEALQHLAFCYIALGRREDFLRVTAYALEHFRTATYADARSRLLAQRAEYYHGAGDDVRAARDAEEAIRVSRGAEEHTVTADALLTLAIVRLAQKRNAEALRLMEEVAKLTPSLGRGAMRSIGAVALWRLGRRAEAYETLRDVLRSVEVERQHVGGDERQERFLFEARVMPYKSLVAMLVADGRFEEALAIAEQSKGRLLLDLLRGGRKIAEERVPAAERQAERALERRVIDLQRRADANAASAEELRRARLDLDELRSTLYAKYPRLRMQRGETPAATLREIQAALPDAHTAFVEYVVSDDDVIAFVVRRHSLHAHRLAVGPERLGARAHTFESVLLQRSLRYQPAARQLFDDLLAPLAHDLAGVDTLCIIPDGALWEVPFEALLDPRGRFVTERFASLYAPSIATFAEMMRSERAAVHGGRLLALADPSGSPALADTRREVAAIGALFAHASVLTGADASYAQIERNAGAADVLHLATHGVLDDDNPMYSRLLVAGGPLTAWQMMRLPLHARLAVLSACSTQRGGFHAGEGLIGMSWALFVGGCTSTLVSHWDVASAPTADLMIAFYREWRTSPDVPFAKSRALRRARLRLIGAPRTHHPMYWAAFVLIGADA